MIRTRHLAEAASRTRAPWLALFLFASIACESPDRLSSPTPTDGLSAAAGATSRFQGIPFGAFAQPVSLYGPIYTGGQMNPQRPESLLIRLSAIKAAKGRVILSLPGGPAQFTNADGTFNFDLWKQRVARYTSVEFGSYISDGTIIGNYIIDQPNCSACWGGQSIPQSTVEAMAQYSKSLWRGMATITRADPTWLAEYSGQYVYLDAGWAQYVMRKGDVNTYLSDNLAAAQSKGLRLVVGLNLLNGSLDGTNLTASQIKDFGSVLVSSSYACAFISWQYSAAYFSQSDIQSALSLLSRKAARHVASSCSRPQN
jgi:hypothetical protein